MARPAASGNQGSTQTPVGRRVGAQASTTVPRETGGPRPEPASRMRDPELDAAALRERLVEPLVAEARQHAGAQVAAARAKDFAAVERLALEHEAQQLRALETVANYERIRTAALSSIPMDERLGMLLEGTRTLLGAQVAAILLMDEEDEKLWPRVSLGFETTLGVRPVAVNGAMRRVITTGASVLVGDVQPDAEFRVGLIEEGIHSLVAAAIRIGSANQGVVVCGHKDGNRFAERDARLLEIVADQMGMALDRRRRLESQTNLRRKAEQVSEFKTELLNMATHDIKTPLSTLAMQLELLRSGQATPAQRRKSVAMMERNVRRLNAMLDDFLDLARVQADRLTIKPTQLDVSALVQESVDLFDAAAKEAGLTLEMQSSKGVRALGDERRILQVVANLLSNAIRYSPTGSVTVAVRGAPDHVEVRVRDAGRGMTAHQLSRLFQPFAQVHDEPGRSQGSGLGLYLSKAIVNAHGGRLWLASRGPGEGTDATFTLPKHSPRERAGKSPFHDGTPVQPPHSPADPANA